MKKKDFGPQGGSVFWNNGSVSHFTKHGNNLSDLNGRSFHMSGNKNNLTAVDMNGNFYRVQRIGNTIQVYNTRTGEVTTGFSTDFSGDQEDDPFGG